MCLPQLEAGETVSILGHLGFPHDGGSSCYPQALASLDRYFSTHNVALSKLQVLAVGPQGWYPKD